MVIPRWWCHTGPVGNIGTDVGYVRRYRDTRMGVKQSIGSPIAACAHAAVLQRGADAAGEAIAGAACARTAPCLLQRDSDSPRLTSPMDA
jgi:hypothetical protein